MKKGFLRSYSVFDIIVIALFAAAGLATKPVIVPLVHIVTGPLFIPGGAIAGGFYMLWIVLPAGLIKKRGAAALTAFTQAIIVTVTGTFGTHGIFSLFTYTMPGLMVDAIYIILRRRIKSPVDFFAAGVITNLTGTFLSNMVFFKLPIVPLILSLSTGALSGGLGGLIAFSISKAIKKLDIEGLN